MGLVYLIPFWSYLADSKIVSAHSSDPDTWTITTLEAIASSSGKNYLELTFCHPDERRKLLILYLLYGRPVAMIQLFTAVIPSFEINVEIFQDPPPVL